MRTIAFDSFVNEMWSETCKDSLVIAALGLTGEAGEVADKLKKMIRGDYDTGRRPEDVEEFARNVALELGDTLFYLTKLAHLHGRTLEDVMKLNIEKLRDRRARLGTFKGSGDHR